ncbi:hypothetical protein [Mycobacterium sp. JS623]|uniref:alpha/beta fold hydrolase n=1 Tax=Mycobacterium sp. JS623 TaxID=212767 RepID=UPI000A026B94
MKSRVICSYGLRRPKTMARVTRSLAATMPNSAVVSIEGAGHAAPFDAPANFVAVITEALSQRS